MTVSNLTCINSPRILAGCQVRGADKEYLSGFIRDSTSLIYWQNLALSTYRHLISLLLSWAPGVKENKMKRGLIPALWDFII